MKIAIIDYGLGNPLSIQKMLRKAGAKEVVLTNNIELLQEADKLVLSGVGHFAKGMENLRKLDLIPFLNELVLIQKKPILGICLGMQLMTSWSEEGNCKGLNWVDATTEKFRFDNTTMKIPHMSWSDTTFHKSPFDKKVFEEMPPRFYYVHSYYVKCNEVNDVLCTAEYGCQFVSGFIKDSVIGVQFHPEKSHVFGQAFLQEFINL